MLQSQPKPNGSDGFVAVKKKSFEAKGLIKQSLFEQSL